MTTTILRAELNGSAEPVQGTSGALIADLKGPTILSDSTPNDGLQSTPLSVSLHSTVIANADGTFVETGTLSVGDNDSVIFATKEPGIITPGSNAADGLTIGAIIWHIIEGTGKYINSSGIITSNFYIKDNGIVTDNITAVIYH